MQRVKKTSKSQIQTNNKKLTMQKVKKTSQRTNSTFQLLSSSETSLINKTYHHIQFWKINVILSWADPKEGDRKN